MGPGDVDSKGMSLPDPPMYSAHCDQQEWCHKVGRWVDIVKTAHDNGTSRHFQTIFKILGRTLFEKGLPPDQQALVAEAQDNGTIDYLQIHDPVAAVRDIVQTVAVDPPIAMVTRLISSFQKVTACRRGRNEDIRVFVSRFRGLAATHLLHANASSSSQIGEVLAVTLFNNANLDEGTLINATSALINHAQAREDEKTDENTRKISTCNYSKLVSIVERMSDLEKERSIPKEGPERKKFMETFRSKSIDEIKQIVSLVKDIKNDSPDEDPKGSVARMFTSDQKHITLHLDDAVKVLRALTQASSSGSGARYTAKDINALVDRKVTALLASHNLQSRGSRNNGSPSNRNPSGGKGSKNDSTPSAGTKRVREADNKEAFFDCGDPDHRRGSDDCQKPSYLTTLRKKRRAEAEQGSNGNQDNKDSKPFFRKRSGKGSNKKA